MPEIKKNQNDAAIEKVINVENEVQKNLEKGVENHIKSVNDAKPEYVILAEKFNKDLPNINNDFKILI